MISPCSVEVSSVDVWFGWMDCRSSVVWAESWLSQHLPVRHLHSSFPSIIQANPFFHPTPCFLLRPNLSTSSVVGSYVPTYTPYILAALCFIVAAIQLVGFFGIYRVSTGVLFPSCSTRLRPRFSVFRRSFDHWIPLHDPSPEC
jgi:hypothetical protein